MELNMKIYHYSRETLEIIAEGIADTDPLDDGRFLIPAHSTNIPPPIALAGKTRHFSAGAWEYRDIQIPPEHPAPTQAEVLAQYTSTIQKRLDDFAQTRNYDSILSACTYATSTVPKFAAEGQYCVDARDATWMAAHTLLAEVKSGLRPMPTLIEVIASMPDLVWPQ